MYGHFLFFVFFLGGGGGGGGQRIFFLKKVLHIAAYSVLQVDQPGTFDNTYSFSPLFSSLLLNQEQTHHVLFECPDLGPPEGAQVGPTKPKPRNSGMATPAPGRCVVADHTKDEDKVQTGCCIVADHTKDEDKVQTGRCIVADHTKMKTKSDRTLYSGRSYQR